VILEDFHGPAAVAQARPALGEAFRLAGGPQGHEPAETPALDVLVLSAVHAT